MSLRAQISHICRRFKAKDMLRDGEIFVTRHASKKTARFQFARRYPQSRLSWEAQVC